MSLLFYQKSISLYFISLIGTNLRINQEKAYDRINPLYLSTTTQAFGIPSTLITCITSLFFSTEIHVNINGHISTQSFTQLRGLRLRVTLSVLYFSILLHSILFFVPFNTILTLVKFDLAQEAPPHQTLDDPIGNICSSLQHLFDAQDPPTNRYTTQHSLTNPSLKIKTLASADDTLVFVRNESDFLRLQVLLDNYMQASNALLNYHKTTAISLSGSPHPKASFSISTQHSILAR